MELVPKNFKQTDIGQIPIDWEVKELAEILDTTQLGGNYSNGDIDSDYPLIKMGNLQRGYITLNKIQYIKNGIVPSDKDLLKYGDVLFNTRNTLDLVGKVAIWRNEMPIAYFNSNIMRLEFNKNLISSDFFMNLIFNTKLSIFQLKCIATGTTSVAAIYTRDLLKINIPIPTKAEQTAIATALSDADNYITHLEKLIAKKRLIKQGAMQELLKPKEGWVVKKLGEIGRTFGGLSGKKKDDFQNGTYPYIPFMNIMSNPVIDTSYFDYVKIGRTENQNKAIKGDLFFNGSSETPEEVGMCSVLLEDIPNLYLNSFCFGFRLINQKEINGLYLSYFFRSTEGRNLIFSSAQGATRYNLSKNNFLKLEIHTPQIEEQNSITEILSEIDAEIKYLEKQLTKANSIKQGMMQQLLTGKFRLV